MDDFIVPDGSDDEAPVKPKSKKRSAPVTRKPSRSVTPIVDDDDDVLGDIPASSATTAQQWKFDPNDIEPYQERKPKFTKSTQSMPPRKQKAHMSEPEKRHTWLVDIRDADGNKVGSSDYDPRTLYIPPMAWNKFSPFEKQYWEIKSKFMDTIVFFKKGKFYELYENDATVGHQLFDLKMTDRVNMRMVGVPEASLDLWANQFVAKGFKIARVDQMETALGKDMRERDEKTNKKTGKPQKEEKVIRRELASVLTAGTLVDGSMLQDDMSTYCAAIKEREIDGLPAFGIAFVDTATAQFQLCDFVDDADMTKFETFVAQTRPGEVILEKVSLSGNNLWKVKY